MALTDALLLDPFPFHKFLALRTDGVAGTGTLNDPLDASTPERFALVAHHSRSWRGRSRPASVFARAGEAFQ